jgi:hypothetical protein
MICYEKMIDYHEEIDFLDEIIVCIRKKKWSMNNTFTPS